MSQSKKVFRPELRSRNIAFVVTKKEITMCFEPEFYHLQRKVYSLTTFPVAILRKDIDVAIRLSKHEEMIRPRKKRALIH